MKRIYLVLILMLIISSNTMAGHRLVRLEGATQEQIRELALDHADIGGARPGEYADIFVNDSDYQTLIEQGYYPEVLIDFSQRAPFIPSEYITYDEMVDSLFIWEYLYPDIAKVIDIGDSWEKAEGGQGYMAKDIWAMKVSDYVDDEENEPSVLFCGAHHSREPPSINVTMNILSYLLNRYAFDETVQNLINNIEIWFVPIVNPDGYKIVSDDLDVWWRKNTHDNNGNSAFDLEPSGYGDGPDGVDLNRNYSFHWADASNNPNDATYRGEIPFSEPETQAMRDLILEQHFVAVNTFHTHGNWILYPWGHGYDQAPDYNLLANIAQTMATYNGYTPQQSSQLYPTGGEMTDWIYSTTGAAAFTTEIAEEFIPPGYMVEELENENLQTNLYLLERSMRSKIWGNITDTQTGEPLEAAFKILEIPLGEGCTQPISDPLHGRYDRLLLPGDYTLVIEKFGYHPQIFNTTVTEDTATQQDAQLIPKNMCTVQGTITNNVGSLVSDAIVKISYNDVVFGPTETDENGFYSIEGVYVASEYQVEISSPNYFTLIETIYVPEDSIFTADFTLYPVESFEGSDGGFVGEGQWQWGISNEVGGPTQGFDGSNVWGTNLTGLYDDHASYYLYTPTYSLEPNEPFLQFQHWLETKENWDGGNVQISTDMGETWEILSPVDGYPMQAIVGLGGEPGFSGWLDEWNSCRMNLEDFADESAVQFRFHFGSLINNLDCRGWFIDYFFITGQLETNVTNKFISQIPEKPILHQNYPNPFNPTTNIQYQLSQSDNVVLNIYDVSGRLVKQLMDDTQEAGYYCVTWDGKNNSGIQAPSGIYFYRMETHKGFVQEIPMVLLK